MIVFPNAKINLGLHVTEKRSDGYHNLETVFYPIPLADALEVTLSPSQAESKCSLHEYGIQSNCPPDKNLVVKAYHLLDKEFNLPHIEAHLYKHIPSGAGLGGGSSDAAFMLKLLNEMFSLKLTTTQLEERASTLGADCAFFIQNRPMFAKGIGNIFSQTTLSLKDYVLYVVKPDVFVSTQAAFAHIVPMKPQTGLLDVVAMDVRQWKSHLKNDFESSVFMQFPQIATVKEQLYEAGALYASMSGSGASVYALFADEVELPNDMFSECFCFKCKL